ncbi:MAG: hypothetical protein MJ252_24815 [archaeon]|nr:hypothetical protein [archaeon]
MVSFIKQSIFCLLILLCLSNFVELKKKKDPKSKKPDSISNELYCDSCRAILLEAEKALKGKNSEADVYAYMTGICKPEKYNVYHFPPPDMREGCEKFLAIWDEQIIKTLINRKKIGDIVQHLCYKKTKACEDADWKKIKQFDDNIMIDGRPVKMADLQKKKEEPKMKKKEVKEPEKEKVNDL